MRVLIIGGGVIGLSIARQLRMDGVRDITVVDRDKMGQEASWAAAGMLAPNAETEEIDDFYRLCTASNSLYDAFCAELHEQTGIDPELDSSGTLQLAFDDHDARRLQAKFEIQRTAGVVSHSLSANEILSAEPALAANVVTGLSYPDDRQVDNRKLVKALLEFCRTNDVQLRENVSAEKIASGKVFVNSVNGPETLSSDLVVAAAGAWTSQIDLGNAGWTVPVRPVLGQILSLRAHHRKLKKVIYAPGCYLVPRADGRLLVGATVEDTGFCKDVSDKATEKLRAAARRVLPDSDSMESDEVWCGLRPGTPDGRPIIGEIQGLSGVFFATGHYRNGILLAPVTARIASDKIVHGIDSEFLSYFGPERLM